MKEQRTGLPDWLILAFAIAMAIFTVIIVIVILYFGTASLAQVLRQHAMHARKVGDDRGRDENYSIPDRRTAEHGGVGRPIGGKEKFLGKQCSFLRPRVLRPQLADQCDSSRRNASASSRAAL